jgi:bacterioferritin-associated ferredoxin
LFSLVKENGSENHYQYDMLWAGSKGEINACTFAFVMPTVSRTCETGALTVEQIYTRLGGGPRCGRCVMQVKDLINAAREKHAPANAS